MCKGDHFLRDFPGIPRILEVWSHELAHPTSPFEAHVDVTPSTSSGKKKGKIRFPYRLCEGNHLLHLCLLMDKTSSILENHIASSPQLLFGYYKLSYDPLSIYKEIDLDSSLVHISLPELGCVMPISDKPLVEKSFNLVSSPIVHSILEENNDHAAHVLLVSSASIDSENDLPILTDQEIPSLIPVEHGGNHVIPSLSSSIISFDWNHFTAFYLPYYIPF